MTETEKEFLEWFRSNHQHLRIRKVDLIPIFRELSGHVCAGPWKPEWTPNVFRSAKDFSGLDEAGFAALRMAPERLNELHRQERNDRDRFQLETRVGMPAGLYKGLEKRQKKSKPKEQRQTKTERAKASFEAHLKRDHPEMLSHFSLSFLWKQLPLAEKTASRFFKTKAWVPLPARTARQVWTYENLARIIRSHLGEVKLEGPPLALELERQWKLLDSETLASYDDKETREKKRVVNEFKVNLPRALFKYKSHAKREEAQKSAIIIIDSDDDEEEPQEELKSLAVEKIKALNVVEKKAFKYFLDKDMLEVTVNNPTMKSAQRYDMVWQHYESLAPDARQKFLDRAQKHYEKKN